MNFLPKPKPPLLKPKPPLGRQKPRNLAEWLETATWYLVPAAEARIRAEIEAHYTEAIKAHLAGGASEPAAQAAALADLGDAHAAARRFRREHLTEKDATEVARSINMGRSVFLGVFLCSVILFMAVLESVMFWLYPPMDNVAALFLIEVLFLLLLAEILVRRAVYVAAGGKNAPAQPRQIILFRAVECFIIGALYPAVFTSDALRRSMNGHLSGFHFWGWVFSHGPAWIMVFVMGSQALNLLRLRKKLQSAGDEALPPRDPAAA